MTPISQMTVGEAISSIRDVFFIFSILVLGWKARSAVQPLITFFKRANQHMDVVEDGLAVILGNHLKHIQTDLKIISGRKDSDGTSSEEIEV